MSRIRRARRRAGLTQIELAEAAGVSPATIGEIEKRNRGASARTLRKLASVLNVEVADLLDEEDEERTPKGPARSELPKGSQAGWLSDEKPMANNVLADANIAVDFDGLQMRLEEFCEYWEGILEERRPDDRDLDRFVAFSKVIVPMIRELMGVEMVQLGSQEPGSEPRLYSERSAWKPGIVRFTNLDILMRTLSGDRGEAQPVSDEVAEIRRMAS